MYLELDLVVIFCKVHIIFEEEDEILTIAVHKVFDKFDPCISKMSMKGIWWIDGSDHI